MSAEEIRLQQKLDDANANERRLRERLNDSCCRLSDCERSLFQLTSSLEEAIRRKDDTERRLDSLRQNEDRGDPQFDMFDVFRSFERGAQRDDWRRDLERARSDLNAEMAQVQSIQCKLPEAQAAFEKSRAERDQVERDMQENNRLMYETDRELSDVRRAIRLKMAGMEV